jgi:hypothetical protein
LVLSIPIMASSRLQVTIGALPSRLQDVAVLRVTQVTPSRRDRWSTSTHTQTSTASTDRGYMLANTCQCSSLPCTIG